MSLLPKPLGQPWIFFSLIDHYISKSGIFDKTNFQNNSDRMKRRVNLWLTICLFLMMLLAGTASSFIGYFMGRQALKVVTQPEASSDDDTRRQEPLGGKYKGLKIIKEEDVLRRVNAIVNAKNKQ